MGRTSSGRGGEAVLTTDTCLAQYGIQAYKTKGGDAGAGNTRKLKSMLIGREMPNRDETRRMEMKEQPEFFALNEVGTEAHLALFTHRAWMGW